MRSRQRLTAPLLLGTCLAATGCSATVPDSAPAKGAAERTGPRASAALRPAEAGDVDFAVPAEFPFSVKNTGDEPLTLTVVKKSCYCTDVRLPEGPIPPGQTGTVMLRWTPIPGSPGPHTMTADVETNDPRTPSLRFEVKGTVNPSIRIAPEDVGDIDFDRTAPGQVALREIRVFSTRLPAFELDVMPADPLLVRAKVTKLEPGTTVGEARVTAGYSVVLQTTEQLPPGSLRSSLALVVKPPGEPARTITLPVYGEVENGVFKVLPSVVEFRKPRAAEADSQKVRVQFFVPSGKDKVEVVRSEVLGLDGKWTTGFLKIEGLRRLPNGQWEFSVAVPANDPVAIRFQPDGFWEGRIFLRASNSPAEVPLRVKWVRPEPR